MIWMIARCLVELEEKGNDAPHDFPRQDFPECHSEAGGIRRPRGLLAFRMQVTGAVLATYT